MNQETLTYEEALRGVSDLKQKSTQQTILRKQYRTPPAKKVPAKRKMPARTVRGNRRPRFIFTS